MAAPSNRTRKAGAALALGAVAIAVGVVLSHASDELSEPAPPLAVFTPTPTTWSPDYAGFPWSAYRQSVTDADKTAMEQMCEWFNAQFGTLKDQIDTVRGNLEANHDNYAADRLDRQADAVVRNVEQSRQFLAPRISELSRVPDLIDIESTTIPIKGGQYFVDMNAALGKVAQHLKARQPSQVIREIAEGTAGFGDEIRGTCTPGAPPALSTFSGLPPGWDKAPERAQAR